MKSTGKSKAVEPQIKAVNPNGISLKYKYSTFKELIEPGDYNFYGIVIDATFPIKVFDNDNDYHLECYLRLIDTTSKITPDMKDSINLIIKSSTIDKVPFIHRIGDIIRVHRGIYNPKNPSNQRNIYLQNLKTNGFKSAFTIFNGEDNAKDKMPYFSSGESYTYELQDKLILENIRNYMKELFTKKNSLNYSYTFNLKDRFNEGSGDLLVYVVKKDELKDSTNFYIMDGTDRCELRAFKYFNFIEENSVIRVRAVKIVDNDVLVMNEFSNMLVVPPYSYLYKTFKNTLLKKYVDLKLSEEVPLYEVPEEEQKVQKKGKKEEVFEKGHFASRVLEKYEHDYTIKSLSEIGTGDDKFILAIRITEIYPKPIYNFVNVLCLNCQHSFFISEVEPDEKCKFNCPRCKTKVPGKMHFNAKLFCKVKATGNKNIALHLNTYDSQGENFFGIPPSDFYRNDKNFQTLVNSYKKICESECLVLVERYKNGLLRIIGEYTSSD